MRPNKGTDGKRSIYGFINEVHRFKQAEWDTEEKDCPVYSPPQKCAKTACLWYSLNDHECWILHPKAVRDRPHKA
jgi:hypothetical protein